MPFGDAAISTPSSYRHNPLTCDPVARVTVSSVGAGHILRFMTLRTASALVAMILPVALPSQVPSELLGTWADDYGSRHLVSDSLWSHDGANTYEIVRWDSAGQYAIARNAASNRDDAGRFTRIDWVQLEGMPPYTWAFCLSIWDAPTSDSAAHVFTARRDAPRTGCGGFPFTRLRREP